MTTEEYKRFNDLRQKVADAIKRELEEDPYCKSYEGTWELTACYPNYFDDNTGTAPASLCQIVLHCYVLGPHRHYTWASDSWDGALRLCEKQIAAWIGEQNDIT